MAHRRLVTLTIAAALVFSLFPASAPQAVDAASCPDPKTAGPQHKTASGFLLPDSGNPNAGCAPQAVDSNWGPNSAGVLAHGCEGTFPNQDNLPNRVTPAWAWLSDQPQIATGTVVTPAAATDRIDGAFVRHSDFPVNHDSHDLDIFVALDNPSLGLMATGNYLRPLDDSGNPEEPEVNRLEVEWEAGRFEGFGNGDWTTFGRGPKLLPSFIWPTGGDRIQVMGQWILDCGHVYWGQSTHYNYRSEIHPPQWMTLRRASLSTSTTDRPATRYDVYRNTSGVRAFEQEWCNANGGLTADGAYLSAGHCGGPVFPSETAIDADLYPPYTSFDAWGTPTVFPPVSSATVAFSYVDQGKGSLGSGWVTTLADHIHLHVPPGTAPSEWGGSFDVFWSLPSGAVPERAPDRYVLSITDLTIDDNMDIVGCTFGGGDWRLWANVNGDWQSLMDQSPVCSHKDYPRGNDFLFAVPPGAGTAKLFAAGYEKDGIDNCFGLPFNAGCLADTSDNPGMVSEIIDPAAAAAQGFRSRQAVSMPTEPGDSPNYTLTYIVQPESVFNSPAASYQFLGRTASQAGGTWTIGPLDRVRLWEPGVRKFTANRIRFKAWLDGTPEPFDFIYGSGAPMDLKAPFGLSSSPAGLYHVRFDASLVLGPIKLDQNQVQSVDFQYDPTLGVDSDPPEFNAYPGIGLPPFFWTSDVQGAHGWITGSETCSIFSQPFCSPSSPQSADLAVLAQDASRITATTVKVDGAATTCGSAGSACGFSIAPDPQSFLWWFSFKQEGVHHIELSATDADPSPAGCTVCGPHTAVSAYDVKLDLSDPSTGLTVTPATPDGTEGWYRTAPVLLTFTGADTPSASGVDRIDYHIEPPLPMEFDAEGERIARSSDGFTRFSIGEGPLKIDADGNYTISYLAVDNAGRHSAPQAANVKLDATAPTISGATTTSPNARGWYHQDVTVHFSASDATSGVASVTSDVTLGEGTNQSVTGSATDHAGNTASTTVGSISVDETSPSLSLLSASDGAFTYTAADLLGGGGLLTNATALSVSYSAADALSGPYQVRLDGVSSTTASGTLTISLPGGASLHTLAAEDQAGNLTTLTFGVVSVPPGSVAASATAEDAGFWKNAVKTGKYTGVQMQDLLTRVDLASQAFGMPLNRYADATLANLGDYLSPAPSPTLDEKARKALLISWLNLAAGRAAASQQVNVRSVGGWQTVVTNTGGSSTTTELNILREVEKRLGAFPTTAQLTTINDLLDGLNSGKLRV